MIEVPAVLERCAGIDIGKKMIAVAVIVGPADAEGVVEVREYGTTVPQLEELRKWLLDKGVTSVAMESTGSYWIPVKNVLEGHVTIILVCPRQYQPARGEKTDFRDARHLAQLHRHGMLRGSFLPERATVELRDLTRRRKKLQSNLSAEKNRIQKVLETANVKMGNVVSDVFGVSGQAVIDVLLKGAPVGREELEGLAKSRLRQRIGELTEALQGHQMTEHHRWLIQQSVDHAVLLDKQLEELEERIQERLAPYDQQVKLLETIPGVKEMTVAVVLSEIGPTTAPFPSARHLASWAGICPGNNRSAGKSKHSRIKKANVFLLSALCQAGKAAAKKQGSLFQRKYQRWVNKLGAAKASVAVARQVLTVIYHVLSSGQAYREPDYGQLHEQERRKVIQHHVKRLRKLGGEDKALDELAANLLAAPPPPPTPTQGEISPERVSRTTPAKVCRGRLGFRARQTRPQTYSVMKHQPRKAPLPGHAKEQAEPGVAQPAKTDKPKKPPRVTPKSPPSPAQSEN